MDNNQENKQEQIQAIDNKMVFGTFPLDNEDFKKRALEAVTKRLDSIQTDHNQKIKDFDTCEQMYLGRVIEQNKDTFAQVNSMHAWNAIEDWTSAIVDAFLSPDPYIKVKPKPKAQMISPDMAYKQTQILMKNANDSGFEENFERGIREGVKCGTYYFKGGYWQLDEDATLFVKSQPQVIGGEQTGQTQNTIEEQIKIEGRAPLSYVDGRKIWHRLDRLGWIVEEFNSQWSVIEKQARENGIYTNLDEAKQTNITQDPNIQDVNANQADLNKLDGDVQLWEAHHIPFTFKEGDPVPPECIGKTYLCIITLANRKIPIRIQITPYRKPPYLIVPFIPKQKGVLGVGMVDIIRDLVIEYNTRNCQSLDANTLGLYCISVVNEKYLKKPSEVKIRPNQRINIKGDKKPDEVIQFIRPDSQFVQVAANLLDRISKTIATSVRLKGNIGGEPMNPVVSAAESQNTFKEAIKAVKLVFRRIDRNIIQDYFQRSYTLLVLNRINPWVIQKENKPADLSQIQAPPGVPPEIHQQVIMKMQQQGQGQVEYEEVTPQDIYSDGIDVEVLGFTEMESEMVERNQNMQLLDLASRYFQAPVMGEAGTPVIFNRYKAMNSVLLSFKKTDIPSWWIPMPPPPTAPVGAPGNMPQPTGAPGSSGASPGPLSPQAPSGPSSFNGPQGPQQLNRSAGAKAAHGVNR